MYGQILNVSVNESLKLRKNKSHFKNFCLDDRFLIYQGLLLNPSGDEKIQLDDESLQNNFHDFKFTISFYEI